MMQSTFDVARIRSHFEFPATGRVVTNNAATTQPPRELTELFARLAPTYESVHRGQSSASQATTKLFEQSYDIIADWLHAPSRRNIVIYRNATEAINSVMYALLTEFRDGDNVVTTMMEHNSNFVPWYALSREILPRFGRQVECRVARFDHRSGELDLDHLASLVDARTKLVCCTAASNFLGTKPPLARVREIAYGSGYQRTDGERGSLLLIDGAQLVPSNQVDVQQLDADFFCFSFHKMLAPFGVGVLYAKERLLQNSLPFLYGGDMIAEGQVYVDHVRYNDLPWKYTAGTPNTLGMIVSAQALRLLVDLIGTDERTCYFTTDEPLPHEIVGQTMQTIGEHTSALTAHALDRLHRINGLSAYGPPPGIDRSPLVAFNVAGWHPVAIADALNRAHIESRAGCHCATLAHHDLGLDPPASCRLSFAVYNTLDEVDAAVDALEWILSAA